MGSFLSPVPGTAVYTEELCHLTQMLIKHEVSKPPKEESPRLTFSPQEPVLLSS